MTDDDGPNVLLVKWGKEQDAVTVGPAETAFEAVARRFDLPVDRVTLVCRGQKYDRKRAAPAATAELLQQSAAGHPALVLGTRAARQLDAPNEAVAPWVRVKGLAQDLIYSAWFDWRPRAWSLVKTVVGVAFAFVGSILPWGPSASTRPRRPHDE